jgi:hypothetical protein
MHDLWILNERQMIKPVEKEDVVDEDDVER